MLFLLLLIVPFSLAADLSLLSPSKGMYNATGENISLSMDYEVNIPVDSVFLQIDNSIQEVRKHNFVKLYENPKFNQEGLLYISPIRNWLRYNFSVYVSEQKTMRIMLSDAAQKTPYIGLTYLNTSKYSGWFCYEGKGLKKIDIPTTLYYDMALEVKNDGRYFYAYDVYENAKKVASCNIPPSTVSLIDLIKIENENKERIITKNSLSAGSYRASFPPGYHKVILFAYLSDGSLYNVSKEFFVVLDGCGDLQCDEDDCAYDCNNKQEFQKGLSIPDWMDQEDFIITIDSTERLTHENGKVYLVFDLEKDQYDATFTLNSLGTKQFYVEDYFFKGGKKNITDLFSFTLDQTVLGNDVIPLEGNHQYTLHTKIDNLAEYSIGENYGILDFGGKTTIYYKVIMPRSLYSQIHLPPEKGVPTFTDRFVDVLKNHWITIIVFITIIVIISLIAWFEKRKIKETTMHIREKYGIDLED